VISSSYILNILDLMLDGDEEGSALRLQIPFLTDIKYNYTGVGLYVSFHSSEEIQTYKHTQDRIVLIGVTITSTELEVGASATLFTRDGIVNYLEIFSFVGDYPRRELKDYKMVQEGTWGTGRSITFNEKLK
jgi:hypothetical protein